MSFSVIQDIQAVREGVVRYRVYLDSGKEMVVHSGSLKRLGLKVGMTVLEQQLEQDRNSSEAAEAREFALRSLAARGRTAGELMELLQRKGFTKNEASVTVAWLREKGLMEEETLLEDTAEALMRSKGIHQVRQIMGRRGFSKADTDRILKEKAQDPERYAAILIQAQKKMKELQNRYPQQCSQRLGAWLYSRGHDGDTIRRILTELKIPKQPEEDW